MTNSSTPGAAAWRARLLREAPLLLGLVLGLACLLHPGLPRFGYPLGADWDTYLGSAAHLWLDPGSFSYNEWRQPLYPLLLGGAGQLWGYVWVGQALAIAGVAAAIVAAGLLGRALVGPWAGGLAALATALAPGALDGSWWVNPYPLAAGCSGLALALAACCARWPRSSAALLAGLAAGAAWGLDLRGLAVVAAVPLVVVLAPVPWGRRLRLLLAVAVGVAVFAALDQGVKRRAGLATLPLSQQVSLQHRQARGPGAPPGLGTTSEAAGCLGQELLPLGPATLLDSCAASRRRLNLAHMQKKGHLPPPAALLPLLALVLVPARWGRRSSLVALVVFGVPLASVLVGISWVPFPDRYLLPQLSLLGALGPVALVGAGKSVPSAGSLGRWCGRASVALALVWLLAVWPGWRAGELLEPLDSQRRRGAEVPQEADLRVHLARWAAGSIGDDDLLVDCADLQLEKCLLPLRVPLRHDPPHAPGCRRLALDPPPAAGQRWLISVHPPAGRGKPPTASRQELMDAGWELVPVVMDPEPPPGSFSWRAFQAIQRWRFEP